MGLLATFKHSTQRFLRISVIAAIAAMIVAALPAVASHSDSTTPNDPLFSRQWGPAQINTEQAWDYARGGGTLVSIIDNGVDLDHEDLRSKVIGGITFRECGELGCGNGDWQSEPPTEDPVTGSLNQIISAKYHGTHVAGIAAAAGNNGRGISGVAPEAKILAVKVIGDFSGLISDVVLGIRWSVDKGADVINLSLASPGGGVLTTAGESPELVEAVEYANSNGVVVVAGAGNESLPLCDTPAFEKGVICVTASGKDEAPADYGNRPIKPDLIAVSAPGGSQKEFVDFTADLFTGGDGCDYWILSTTPAGAGSGICEKSGGYSELYGTSMATPHVSGAAAVLVSQGRSRRDVIKLLTCTARNPITGTRGSWDPIYGFGIIDVGAAAAADPESCTGGVTVEEPPEGDNGNGKGKGKGGNPGNGGGESSEEESGTRTPTREVPDVLAAGAVGLDSLSPIALGGLLGLGVLALTRKRRRR